MKFFLKLKTDQEPSVTVVCDKVTGLVKRIEQLCAEACSEAEPLYGFDGEEILPLQLSEVSCFFTRAGKVYARVEGEEYATKLRMKEVLLMVDDSFVKINQGCVVAVKYIKKFRASLGGALRVVLHDGYTDDVARRELSQVKRRMGL